MSKIDEVRLGFETAYIDGSVASSSVYRPQFVSNNYKEGKKVLSSIEDELLECEQFQISVASDLKRIRETKNSRQNFDH